MKSTIVQSAWTFGSFYKMSTVTVYR